jgi:hypothetical protein
LTTAGPYPAGVERRPGKKASKSTSSTAAMTFYCSKGTPDVKLHDGYLGMQKHHYRQEKTMISHVLPNRTGGVSTKNHMYIFCFQGRIVSSA